MEGTDPITFFREVYADNAYRVEGKRSLWRDLKKFFRNRFLRELHEKRLIRSYYAQRYPILFIVGVPRAGTTFFSQALIHAFRTAYISNFMAAHWMAPLYAKIQRDREREKDAGFTSFHSHLGGTEGLDSPHEFGYFWQYWMKHPGHDELGKEDLDKVPWERIREELYSISHYEEAPLLIKSVDYTNFIIPRLSREFPLSSFLFLDREPEPTVRSILRAREKRYGDRSVWWSVRPKGYKGLKVLSPEEQVAFQYFYIKRNIEEGISKLSSERVQKVNYEELIRDPEKTLESLEKLQHLKGLSSRSFGKENIIKKDEEGEKEIAPELREAIEQFRNMTLKELQEVKKDPKK